MTSTAQFLSAHENGNIFWACKRATSSQQPTNTRAKLAFGHVMSLRVSLFFGGRIIACVRCLVFFSFVRVFTAVVLSIHCTPSCHRVNFKLNFWFFHETDENVWHIDDDKFPRQLYHFVSFSRRRRRCFYSMRWCFFFGRSSSILQFDWFFCWLLNYAALHLPLLTIARNWLRFYCASLLSMNFRLFFFLLSKVLLNNQIDRIQMNQPHRETD